MNQQEEDFLQFLMVKKKGNNQKSLKLVLRLQGCKWIITSVLLNFVNEILSVKNNIGSMRD